MTLQFEFLSLGLLVHCLTLLVLYPKFGIGNGVYHHEGHLSAGRQAGEEHEGRENHVEIRSLF